MGTLSRSLKRAGKFAAVGALILGVAAFLHVAWDTYKFGQSGRTPVDAPVWVFLSITLLGIFTGAALGGVAGFVVGALQRGKNDAGAI